MFCRKNKDFGLRIERTTTMEKMKQKIKPRARKLKEKQGLWPENR